MRIYVPTSFQTHFKETHILCVLHQISSRQIDHFDILPIIHSPSPHLSPPPIADDSLALLHVQQAAQIEELAHSGRFEPELLLMRKLRPKTRLFSPPRDNSRSGFADNGGSAAQVVWALGATPLCLVKLQKWCKKLLHAQSCGRRVSKVHGEKRSAHRR